MHSWVLECAFKDSSIFVDNQAVFSDSLLTECFGNLDFQAIFVYHKSFSERETETGR
jgi:hypothetical protein